MAGAQPGDGDFEYVWFCWECGRPLVFWRSVNWSGGEPDAALVGTGIELHLRRCRL